MANPSSQSYPFPTSGTAPSGSAASTTPTSTDTQQGNPVPREPGPRGSSGAPTLDSMVQGAHDAVDRVAEKAGPAVERLRAGVHGAAEAMQVRADHLAALSDEWMEACRSSVRQHPLAAVALAVVAGVAVGRLLAPPPRD
jgi:ElaB/YqjD/DUF883 family membrane-anchored ribosome-binding protein